MISYLIMLRATPAIAIDESDIQIDAVRASGPGGQNVNKVSSAIQLRFDAANCPTLPADVRLRLLKIAGRRATNDGVIIIKAQQSRRQDRNREDALERLLDMIRQAAVRPKTRRKTKPTRGSKERRLDSKRQRSETKSTRTRVKRDD